MAGMRTCQDLICTLVSAWTLPAACSEAVVVFRDVTLKDVDGEGFHEGLVHAESKRVCMFWSER